MPRRYSRSRKGEEHLFWILHKIMEIYFVFWLMFGSATSLTVLCMYNFVLNDF